jgi:hypothetical protein
MDITVTTPLEMNIGQQKYVVAYTLKQGTEKQPDILNAQKLDNIESAHKMSSPASMRPDGLFSTILSSSSSSSTKNSKVIEPKCTSPPANTLKYNDNDTKGYTPLNQTINGNYNAQPPPYCSTMMNDFEAPLNYTVNYNTTTSGAMNASTNATTSYHKMSPEYNNLNNFFTNDRNATSSSSSTTAAAAVAAAATNHHLNNELLEKSDGFLDFEKTILDNRLPQASQDHVDYKYHNGPDHHDPNTSHHRYGYEYATESVDYKNLANQIANTISNINSTLSRSRNRNHILTDNLPGPESCV